MDEPPADTLNQRLMRAQATLSTAERKVAELILNNPLAVLASSAAEVAAMAGTSDATVIRTARALGFNGLGPMRRELTRSLKAEADPANNLRRTIAASGEDVATAIRLALDAARASLDDLLAQAEALQRAVQALHAAQRIVVFGMGPTASIARYAAALLTRTGWRTRVLDAAGRALGDQLLELGEGDRLLMLAYGTPYREAVTTFREAVRLGLPAVLLTDDATGGLTRFASVVVPVRRGSSGHVALHGATVAALEAIALGLAVADPAASTAALDKLNRLRGALDARR